MIKNVKIYLLLAGLIILGCKEPYNPVVTTTNSNLLVVEGLINAGADSTIINLSRTVIIANKTTANPEPGAVVTVESDANETFSLKEEKKGIYSAPPLGLNASKKYRLRIKTSNGSTYLSDYVEVKLSPVIENVGYDVLADGVRLHVSTKDINNKSIYYRWEYQETWIFYAKYDSFLYWNGTSLAYRDRTNNNIYQCWGNEKSSKILLGSSAKLAQDVIYQLPINLIPSTSEKLGERYSILVKQYVLTKDAYEFWQNLKKNTESLGSIFDAQPSQLASNIHNVNDATEPVIGYISVGSMQQQRIYLTKDKFPNFKVVYPYDCGILGKALLKEPGDARTYFFRKFFSFY